MRKTRWIVGVDWIDGPVEDTSEIVVFAESANDAKLAATRKWRLTIGADTPHRKVQRVFVLTPEMIARSCY